jgi:Flp pilus assembly protein TadD
VLRSAVAFVALASLLWGCGGSTPGSDPARTLAIVQKGEDPKKLLDRARAFAAVGDTSRAEQYFAAAIAHGADEAVVIPQLVKVCVRDGRYELAIDYAQRYAQQHPSDSRIRYLLGTLYAAIGDGGRARRELEFVVTAKPDDAEPHWALAKVLLDEAKDPALAEDQFREYLRLAPTGTHAEEARASITKEVQQP